MRINNQIFMCFLAAFTLITSVGVSAQEKNNAILIPVIELILSEENNAGVVETIPSIPKSFEGKYYLTIAIDFDSEFSTDEEYIYTQLNSNVDVSTGFSDSIGITVEGGGLVGSDLLLRTENFRWEMSRPRSGPDQGRLTEGVFEDIERFPSNGFANGLSVSGNGSSCTPQTGRFRIFDIEYTEDVVTKLISDFEYNCFGRTLIGSIDFDDSRDDAIVPDVVIPQLPAFPPLPDLNSSGGVLVVEGSDDTPILGSEGLLLDDSNSTFTVSTVSGPRRGVAISWDDGNTSYRLDLRRGQLDIDPQREALLSVGQYGPATRASFSQPLAGLDFGGNGRGCNRVGGSFNVYEIEFNESDELVKLLADFEQSCSTIDEPLRGSVHIDLTLPN